jgi:hypothetical protein
MSIRTTRSMAAPTFEVPRWFTEAGRMFSAKNVRHANGCAGTPVDLAIPLRFSTIVHIDDALISHREAATCVGLTST